MQLQSAPLSNPEGLLPASSKIPVRFLKYLHIRSFQNQIQKTICHSCSSPTMFSYCHACLSRAKQYAFHNPTAKISLQQTPLNFENSHFQQRIRQPGLSRPPCKIASFKNHL
jgi:hypothetical protein